MTLKHLYFQPANMPAASQMLRNVAQQSLVPGMTAHQLTSQIHPMMAQRSVTNVAYYLYEHCFGRIRQSRLSFICHEKRLHNLIPKMCSILQLSCFILILHRHFVNIIFILYSKLSSTWCKTVRCFMHGSSNFPFIGHLSTNEDVLYGIFRQVRPAQQVVRTQRQVTLDGMYQQCTWFHGTGCKNKSLQCMNQWQPSSPWLPEICLGYLILVGGGPTWRPRNLIRL